MNINPASSIDLAAPSILANATTNEPVSTNPIAANTIKLKWWQRLFQYHPSSRLVRILLCWWLIVVMATLFDLSNGLGIDVITGLVPILFGLCQVALIFIVLLCLYDGIWLMAMSQVDNYTLKRQYPNNVPIHHELNIDMYLSYSINSDARVRPKSTLANLAKSLHKMGLVKSIFFELSDHYPTQLQLVDSSTNQSYHNPVTYIHAAVMCIPVKLALNGVHTENELLNKKRLYEDDESQAQINTVKVSYPVIPVQRGTGYFAAASIRVWSPFRLFNRQFDVYDRLQDNHYLRVLADFSGLLNNQLAALYEKSPHAGLQTLIQKGQGSDFFNLRDYAAGDAIRQIDWKASSRQRRLMSKTYEDDNDQQVVFLLDCGEQMRHQNDDNETEIRLDIAADDPNIDDGNLQVSFFDKVLNAILLLSYIANKQSDSVGVMTFGGIDKYIPPKKGVSLIRNLLNETADLKPTMQTSDYLLAAQVLRRYLKKRSLIVVITNTRTEASTELIQAIRLLAGHHQIVFANLTEQIVYDKLHGDSIPDDLDDALLFHALNSYEKGRLQLHQILDQQCGALCLYTTANKLPYVLTQAYLSLKHR